MSLGRWLASHAKKLRPDEARAIVLIALVAGLAVLISTGWIGGVR